MQTLNLKYRVYTLILLALLLLASCAPAPANSEGSKPVSAAPIGDVPVGAVPADTTPLDTSTWQTFSDEEFGFTFRYPADWLTKELVLGGPGMPEDWPVQRDVIFFPAEIADRFDRQGPPDPNAPPATPTLILSVCVGPQEQYQRAYAPVSASVSISGDGVEGVLEYDEREDFNAYRYVFTRAGDPEVRVILDDTTTGFSERVKANPEYTEILRQIASTFSFTP